MILAVERGAMQAFARYDAVGWSLIWQEAIRLIGALALVAIGLDVTGAFLGSMIGFGAVAIVLAFPLHRELERVHTAAPGEHVEHPCASCSPARGRRCSRSASSPCCRTST